MCLSRTSTYIDRVYSSAHLQDMDKSKFEKATAELPILRRFIDFVNSQIGVYCDSLSSFRGNKVRIERQKARVQRPASKRIENERSERL